MISDKTGESDTTLYVGEEMKTITKDERLKEQYKLSASQGDWKSMFEESIDSIPLERRRLLWEIFMEADWGDKERMEDMIYAYGSQLGSKDHLGRWLFVRMATMVRQIRFQ